MQLEKLKQSRDDYILELQKETSTLENVLRTGKNQLDIHKFKDLFSTVKETNKEIREFNPKRKNSVEVLEIPENNKRCRTFSKGTWLFLGALTVNAVVVTGFSIYNFVTDLSEKKDHTQCPPKNKGPVITEFILKLIDPLLVLVIGEAIREGNNDRRDWENTKKSVEILNNLSEVKDFGAKAALKFLSVFEEFQEEMRKNNEKILEMEVENQNTKKLLSKCVKKLKKVPKKSIKDGIFPDNKLWISHLVNSFSGTDKFIKEKINTLNENDDDQIILKEFTESQIHLKSVDSSSEDDNLVENSFNGERGGISMLSIDSNFCSIPKKNVQTINPKHQKTWEEIEEYLNLELKMLVTDKAILQKQKDKKEKKIKKTNDFIINL